MKKLPELLPEVFCLAEWGGFEPPHRLPGLTI